MTVETETNVIEKVRNKLEEMFNPTYYIKLYNDDDLSGELVTERLQTVLGITYQQAWCYMMEAHKKGSSIVYAGSQSDCKNIRDKLAAYQLTVDIVKN